MYNWIEIFNFGNTDQHLQDVSASLSLDRVTDGSTKNKFFSATNFVKMPPKVAKLSDITQRMLRNQKQIFNGLLPQERSYWIH